MMYTIREATLADAQRIAPLLRESDRREVEAATGVSPEVCLPRSFAVEPSGEMIFAETAAGEPILIGGVRPTPDHGADTAAVWMFGTPLLDEYGFALARAARRQVDA